MKSQADKPVAFKGAVSQLNGLKNLAYIFNFVVGNWYQSSPSFQMNTDDSVQ